MIPPGPDSMGVWMRRLLGEMFEGVKEHVILLDGWDMTVALENEDVHPHVAVPRAMVQQALEFFCH